MHIQNLVKFCPFFLKILSGNKNLTTIIGHNSFTNFLKMTGNNPNLDLVNINAYMKFGKSLFIFSQDIERKRKSDINQGPYLCYKVSKGAKIRNRYNQVPHMTQDTNDTKLRKMTGNNPIESQPQNPEFRNNSENFHP